MIYLLSDVVEKIREKNLDFTTVTRINGLNSPHIVTAHFLRFFPQLTHFDGTVRLESRDDIPFLSTLQSRYLVIDLQGRMTNVEQLYPFLGMETVRFRGVPRFHGHPEISEVEVTNLEFKFLKSYLPIESYLFWLPLLTNHRITTLHADGLPLDFLNELPSNIKLLIFTTYEGCEAIVSLNPKYEIGCYGCLSIEPFHVNRYVTQMNFPYCDPGKMVEVNPHLKSVGISPTCLQMVASDKIRVGWYRTTKERDRLISRYPGITVIKSSIVASS